MAQFVGLQWQTVQISWAAGVQTRADDKIVPGSFLHLCADGTFDQTGALTTRPPFGAPIIGKAGGGTIDPATMRRVATDADGHLLLFTQDALYAFDETFQQFVPRGTHLAIDVMEDPTFATNGDQTHADRATLNAVTITAWQEAKGVYVGATDPDGVVLVAPTKIATTTTGRPRVLALGSRIFVFFFDSAAATLNLLPIDPSNLASIPFGFGGTIVLPAADNVVAGYDVAVTPDGLAIYGACLATNKYYTFKVTVTIGGIVTIATFVHGLAYSFTSLDAIGVAITPDSTRIAVLYTLPFPGGGPSPKLQLDLYTAPNTFVSNTQFATGHLAQHLTGTFKTVKISGNYPLQVFWSGGLSPEADSSTAWGTFTTLIETGPVVVHAITRIGGEVAVASHAFYHSISGFSFVWVAFGSSTTFVSFSDFTTPKFATQSTYFLLRDDGHLAACTVAGRSGGLVIGNNDCVLPGVQVIGPDAEYVWCGIERRRIEAANNGRAFAARSPVTIGFTFDSDRARRTTCFGPTTYVTGSELKQYDGVRLVELGHHLYPWLLTLFQEGLGHNNLNGTYAYKITYRYTNAKNENDRSTSTAIGAVPVVNESVKISANLTLTITHKTDNPPAIEVWRTQVAPQLDSPFYLVSANNPSNLYDAALGTGQANWYQPNDPTVDTLPDFVDRLPDSALATVETNPENEGTLENVVPPPATLIFTTDTRMFLGDIAGQPDVVWYSMFKQAGRVAQFNDALQISVPSPGGRQTAICVYDETLYVFRERAIYEFPGQGLNDLGEGQNYGPVRIVSIDVGLMDPDAIVVTPIGVLFKAFKGWHLLTGQSLRYVGEPIAAYDVDEVLGAVLLENTQQVRILTADRLLVWDYREAINQWGVWSIGDGVSTCLWAGQHVYLGGNGVRIGMPAVTGLTGLGYSLDAETSWLKPATLIADVDNQRVTGGQGNGYVRKIQPLGELRSPCYVLVRVAYDYAPSYVEQAAFFPDPAAFSIGQTLQIAYSPRRRKCEAFRVRITAIAGTTLATHDVLTTLGRWSAILGGVFPRTVSLAFLQIAGLAAPKITVRDDQAFQVLAADRGVWSGAPNTCTILVRTAPGQTVSTAAIEAAITATSRLVTVVTPDAPHSFATDDLAASQSSVPFAFAPCDGEGIQLTSLGLEVAADPGLYNRLPRANRG